MPSARESSEKIDVSQWTPEKFAKYLAKGHPHNKFAYDTKAGAVGQWVPAESRYVKIYSQIISGGWVFCRFDVLVNGKPCEYDWIEA